MEVIFAAIVLFILLWIFSNKNISAESPYIYSCPANINTPTPATILSVTPTISPSLIPSTDPTPTSSIANTCLVGGTTINKGEGICDEKANLVTQCEGNNQMIQKPNFCGTGQVCRTQTNNFQIKCDSTCQLKLGTGMSNKADLVVLAEDYNSHSEFLAAVDKAVVAMNKTNLSEVRLGKFNLWALLDLNQTFFQGFNCPTAGGATVACWDHMKAFNLAASKCGGDSYLVFNNDTHRTGSVGGISIWGGTYIYNFALDQPTVPHELGHSLAGLMDEYSFGIAAPSGSVAGINCSSTGSASETTPCPKWAGKFPNVGCYLRCGYTNFYRPTFRSIMDRGGTGAVYEFNEPSLVDGWDEMLKLFP